MGLTVLKTLELRDDRSVVLPAYESLTTTSYTLHGQEREGLMELRRIRTMAIDPFKECYSGTTVTQAGLPLQQLCPYFSHNLHALSCCTCEQRQRGPIAQSFLLLHHSGQQTLIKVRQ